jgi:hypothetical protein
MSSIKWKEILFQNHRCEELPEIERGYVRVAATIEFERGEEYLQIRGMGLYGRFRIPYKIGGYCEKHGHALWKSPWGLMFNTNFKEGHEYVDIPFWVARECLNICDKYGNLVDFNGNKLFSKKEQKLASLPWHF